MVCLAFVPVIRPLQHLDIIYAHALPQKGFGHNLAYVACNT
jgi:hypothetical protein